MDQHFDGVFLLVIAHLLNVRAAISVISVPVGPHGSLLVAVSRRQLLSSIYCSLFQDQPFRTLTCTCEYPFVTFLTLLTTFDMAVATGGCTPGLVFW